MLADPFRVLQIARHFFVKCFAARLEESSNTKVFAVGTQTTNPEVRRVCSGKDYPADDISRHSAVRSSVTMNAWDNLTTCLQARQRQPLKKTPSLQSDSGCVIHGLST